ncbi:Pyridoxal biosynthesis lyase PdxS [compost metagenome]
MADPTIVEDVMQVVSIPVMAKARIGHYVEAKVLESLGVDYIDESTRPVQGRIVPRSEVV